MLTKSTATSTLQTITGVQSTDTANTATLLQFWNDSRRTVASIGGGKWPWLEIEEQVNTVANQDYVEIPNHVRRVVSVRQENGSPNTVVYLPKMIFDPTKWDLIIAMRLGTSNVPYFVYEYNQRLYIRPTPSEINTVIMRGRINIRDVSIDDYSSGSLTDVTTGTTTVHGSSSNWTASMAGRYLQIAESNNNNWGDGYWYQIASVTNATTLELKKPYQGTTITAGTPTYIIGQITYEPEAYQMAPIYRAVAQYWDLKENMVLSERYWRLYDGGMEIGKSDLPQGMIGQMLAEAGESMEGPYISPDSHRYDNAVPYWLPYDLASGF